MYGQNYKPMEPFTKLEDGHYIAQIKNVEEKATPKGKSYLEITIAYKDHPGAIPNKGKLWDCPTEATANATLEERVNYWCMDMTAFFDNFKIPRGNMNYKTWINAIGTVTVQPQKGSKYKEIIFREVEPAKAEQVPEAVKQVASAFDGMGFAVAPENGFPSNF